MTSFTPPIGSYNQYEELLQSQQPIKDEIGYYNYVIHKPIEKDKGSISESRYYCDVLKSRWIKTNEDGSKIIYFFECETGNYCWYYQSSTSNQLIKHNFNIDDPTEVSQTKGYRAWYHMGKLHRWNAEPAVIHHNGKKTYAFLGEFVNSYAS